jgi:hypothetical protein
VARKFFGSFDQDDSSILAHDSFDFSLSPNDLVSPDLIGLSASVISWTSSTTVAVESNASSPVAALHSDFGSHSPLLDGGSDITVIDVDAFARGGSGGGSGGSGGGGAGTVSQYFSGAANGSAGYDIWIEFKGTGWTTELQKAFVNAADYLTTVITDDIGGDSSFRGKLIDDLYVSAELKAIDGTGGVLGQSGPTAVWSANQLTAAGQMQFDVADAAAYLSKGLWDDIVMHELMHVEGFGSLWNYGNHALVSGAGYIGPSALAAYQAAVDPTATFIPVEQDGGSGTAGSHWDEQALGNELMTGYINEPTNYLSEFSVMSLQDLGYKVTFTDPYDLTSHA